MSGGRVLLRPRNGWGRGDKPRASEWLVLVFGFVAAGVFVNYMLALFQVIAGI